MNILMTLAEGFADSSFARLFTEMPAVTAVLFIVGIIFCAIEMFIPGFGFFGISGVIMIVAGIIVRLVCGGDAMMFLYMVLIAFVLFFIMFFVVSKAITKGKLGKTSIFNIGTAVPEDKTEGTADFSDCLNQVGKAQTMLRPVGKVRFGDVTYDAVARDGFIDADTEVVCVQVEGQRIVVVKNENQ